MHATWPNQNLAPWERALSLALGAAMVGTAVRSRRLFSGAMISGTSLIARGAAGYCPVSHALGARPRGDTRVALGGARGIMLEESITIAQPPHAVFAFWRDVDNLPQFIRGLEQVERLTDTRTRWTFVGPAGVHLIWDAETINEMAPELIAWRSLPGADVVSAGSVHFDPARNASTLVTVKMQYSRSAGHPGVAFGWIVGRPVASELREDLRRLKQVLEASQPSSAKARATTVS